MRSWPSPADVGRAFIKWFVALAGFGLALAGTYYGLAAAGVRWLFWLIVVLASAGALVVVGSPLAFRAWEILRNHDRLLNRVRDLEEALDEREDEVNEMKRRTDLQYQAGRMDGIKETLGAVGAERSGDLPTLYFCIDESGKLMLIGHVAEDGDALLGARYRVRLDSTGALIGTVEVISYDEERSWAHLNLVRQEGLEVWERLAEHATTALEPADGISVERTTVDEIVTTMMQDGGSLLPPLGEQVEDNGF
jgi:hypothetical protein